MNDGQDVVDALRAQQAKADRLRHNQAQLRAAGFVDTPTPWIEETVKCLADDGAYADYHGWKIWLVHQWPNVADAVDDMDEPAKSELYVAFIEATNGGRTLLAEAKGGEAR